MNKELVTVEEFARLAGVSRMTVYRRLWHGRLPGAVRQGRRILIPAALAAPEPYQKRQRRKGDAQAGT